MAHSTRIRKLQKGDRLMKKRSNIKVMLSLVGLVKPLILVMLVAIFMGVLGNIAASIITILGGAIFVNLWMRQILSHMIFFL